MKRYLLPIICLLPVLAAVLYFRSFPVNFPQLKIQARTIINESAERFATQSVYQKFPDFYHGAKDKIAKAQIAELKRQNKEEMGRQVEALYAKLKDPYQDEQGQTYLMELDCWHWARYVDNVLKLGHPGDETINGNQWDLLMLAPNGFYILWDQFLFYLSASLYRIFSFFQAVPLFTFLFYLPLFFAAVFFAVLFFYAYRLGGLLAAVLSCLIIGTAPIFMQRSFAGWFDKDVLNLLFPLLVVWAYTVASVKLSLKVRLTWVCFAAFWTGLFCFNWSHWWFIFFVIIIYEIVYLAYAVFLRLYLKRNVSPAAKMRFISVLSYCAFTFLWILILVNKQPLVELYRQTVQALTLNKPLMATIWPNVLSTVGELRRANVRDIAHAVGGWKVLIPSLAALLGMLTRPLWQRQPALGQKRISIVILSIWFFAMFFASLRGVRFVVFLLIPLGIAFGLLASEAFEFFKAKKNLWGIIGVFLVSIFYSVASLQTGYTAGKMLFPLMNDTWYKVLNLMREKTTEETVVNSWWDFGDWFKAVAHRRVIFDGQSQHVPQAYWMAKVILCPDEEKAIRILRMLNNGGNKAFEIIDEYIHEPLQSVLLLEKVLEFDQAQEVKAALLDYLPESKAEEVVRLLFYAPAKAVFVVEFTMIPKMPAISYLGNWDFSKMYIAKNFNVKEKNQLLQHLKKMGRSGPEIQKFYQEAFLISTQNMDEWLSNRLQFYGGVSDGIEKDGQVYFNNGFIYTVKDQTVISSRGQLPRSIFTVRDGNLAEIVTPNANVPFSIFIMQFEDGYKSILLDRQLANTMFTRLYFFNGYGLTHFKSFIDVEDANRLIRVFTIQW